MSPSRCWRGCRRRNAGARSNADADAVAEGGRPLFVVGCDEAGVGALAGPIVAAACAIDKRHISSLAEELGLADSKKLTEARRRAIYESLRRDERVLVRTGIATNGDVDILNPLNARMKAMKLAIEGLPLSSMDIAECIIDGDRVPDLLDSRVAHARGVVKADASVPIVSAASVIAKVTRDVIMTEAAKEYPLFQFQVRPMRVCP